MRTMRIFGRRVGVDADRDELLARYRHTEGTSGIGELLVDRCSDVERTTDDDAVSDARAMVTNPFDAKVVSS
jgi:hypothetical protein